MDCIAQVEVNRWITRKDSRNLSARFATPKMGPLRPRSRRKKPFGSYENEGNTNEFQVFFFSVIR